jgi:hypothetical protein
MENNCLSEILFLHDEIQEAVRTSLDKAIRIGQLLTQQKAELGHGEWGLWFDDNLAGTFSRATANNYMKLYEERDRLKILNVRNIAAGLRIIYGKTKVQHSRKGQPRPNADPVPKTPKANRLQFTERQEKEYTLLLGDLCEREFLGASLEIGVLRALRFAKQRRTELDNAQLRTLAEYLNERGLGEEKFRELAEREPLPEAGVWSESDGHIEAEWGTAAIVPA